MLLDIFRYTRYKDNLGPFFQALFQGSKRRVGFVLLILLATTYGWVFLRGPQGLQTLLEKRREIRELQERNAEKARENELRKDRIHRLEDSRSEQEMEIRKQLKLLRPGETTFILPDPPKDNAPASNNSPPTQANTPKEQEDPSRK